ncbi:uncharacterized protein PHACADRAFT_164264 [Phanerochaete carnosa HHB-10118-sp]|uniref:Uncharacterized protein n=1 Tax=Phanerochaete carnosa (strain HHB-10118-sp) TaxID=650164 RepID=K5WPU5_PHACS|nr:uncharacterized protein PHACADRAFT_164264 [Phanerochaete carnosa HHB-10118-sp]EKM52342.1 hypothetical protein PHACADRAFT_164264 [Phanerochaete carnosa HHB-10118-sp]
MEARGQGIKCHRCRNMVSTLAHAVQETIPERAMSFRAVGARYEEYDTVIGDEFSG